jgi:hypothetical protein
LGARVAAAGRAAVTIAATEEIACARSSACSEENEKRKRKPASRQTQAHPLSVAQGRGTRKSSSKNAPRGEKSSVWAQKTKTARDCSRAVFFRLASL